MVMQYWIARDPILDPAAADESRIYALLARVPGKGISGLDLRRYLEEKQYTAIVLDGEPGDLSGHLAKGRPLVVCLAPRGIKSPLHYVVLVGISDSEVLYHDSARGKLIRESMIRFRKHWQAAGNWLLIATPRSAP